MIKSSGLVIAAFLSFSMVPEANADHGKNFHCDFNSFVHPKAAEAMKKIAGSNKGLMRVVEGYTLLWENAEIRRVCDSAASGNDENFGCMGGRQDWNAIKQSIPSELLSMSSKALRPHYLALQKKQADAQPRNKVLNYCGKLGVVARSFK